MFRSQGAAGAYADRATRLEQNAGDADVHNLDTDRYRQHEQLTTLALVPWSTTTLVNHCFVRSGIFPRPAG